MPPTVEESRVGKMVILGEVQLLLMRHLVLRLSGEGTPDAELVRLTAQLDQLEASVTRTKALLLRGAERPGCQPTCRGLPVRHGSVGFDHGGAESGSQSL